MYFERERGRERIPSRVPAVILEPDTGLHLMNHEIMTTAEIKTWPLNQLSHPGTHFNKWYWDSLIAT